MSTLNSFTERRYQKTKSPYFMPQDVIEQNRLDAQAAAIVEMIGGAPCIAPVQHRWDVSKAVDVGCGTGVATIQIAAIFPTAKVYGLDLSPVPQAVQSMAPSNVAWAEGNVLDVAFDTPSDDTMSREIFVPDNLDYIFGRMLFLGIDNWSSYFSTTYRSLKSGGMIEHQDLDWAFYRVGTDKCLSDQWEWHQAVLASATHFGISRSAGSGAEVAMKAAGFDVLSVQRYEYSFVPSSKTPTSQAMGRYVQAKLIPQYPDILRKVLGARGIVGEELERLTKDCLRDISSEEGIYQKYTVTIARKP
ncbi:MAG: hypothetical protein L6R37_004668 [Teloschistes peruensis]|nr:MAG: hypothetical protein L6R37_004668 [Teloschistes peruensis]